MREFTLRRNEESGAALMTVLVATLLLGTACIALLTAVGASARNNTDALSEAKAYWAAESGLQKTIDLLRHGGVTYAQANSDPDLSTWLGTGAVVVSSEASYTVEVDDPDNVANSTTFGVTGLFKQADETWAESRTFTNGTNTTRISFDGVANILVTHPMAVNDSTSFGSFRVESTATAVPAADLDVEFKLLYTLAAPLGGTRTIRGKITDGVISYTLAIPEFRGSTITICGSMGCPTSILGLLPATTAANTSPVNGRMTPIEPVRLVVKATGYGPNSSSKILEGVIQKNFLNGLGSDNAITLLGPPNCANIDLGSSGNMDILGGSSPSIGVAGTGALTAVTTAMGTINHNASVEPAPEIYNTSELPDWQQSPAALDAVVRQLRQTAMNSGRYRPSTDFTGGWGDNANGTGLTFCEGDCEMSGSTASGGGILVVTGTLTTNGKVSFNGLVLVTGAGGVIRGGNGQDVFAGNTIIAPYNPNNLAAGWGCPSYVQKGGAGDTINTGLNETFDGTEAISNFMIGVAEK